MRALVVALAALVLLAGCSSPPSSDPADAADPSASEASVLSAANATLPHLRFGASDQEATLPLQFDWASTEPCPFRDGGPCTAGPKTVDLTGIVPADVPVEMALTLAGDGNYGIELVATGVTFIDSLRTYNSGTYRIDASLVRAPGGTLALEVRYYIPSIGSAAGAHLEGSVHTVSRSAVVPPFVPVGLQLAPGDTVAAIGHGVRQLILVPPGGDPLRAVQLPFNLTVPADAPTGLYIALVDAREAVVLAGPDQTLSARQLVYLQGDRVDLPAATPTSWTMDVPGLPLRVGVTLASKEGGNAMVLGDHEVGMRAPGNVEVLASEQSCVLCGATFLGGSMSWGYSSAFMDEHLLPGTYESTATMAQGNEMQAYSWALYMG